MWMLQSYIECRTKQSQEVEGGKTLDGREVKEGKKWSLVFKPLRYSFLSELKLENLKGKSSLLRKPGPMSEYQGQ